MIVLKGQVTEVANRSYNDKQGNPVDVFDVFILNGRNIIKTTGPMNDSDYHEGQKVILTVNIRAFKTEAGAMLSADRIKRLTPAEAAALMED